MHIIFIILALGIGLITISICRAAGWSDEMEEKMEYMKKNKR